MSLAAYGVLLIVGHGAVDATAGARPALIQLFRANLGLSYTVLGSLVTASSLCGAAAQVIFGLAADATHRVWMAPAGIALVTLGMSAAGFVPDRLGVWYSARSRLGRRCFTLKPSAPCRCSAARGG
jgi:hypothetical protein